MIIFRVYSSYHSSSESGTTEYGYFTSLEKARQRAEHVARESFGAKGDEATLTYHGNSVAAAAPGYWESTWINVEQIEVDKDMNHNNTGYT